MTECDETNYDDNHLYISSVWYYSFPIYNNYRYFFVVIVYTKEILENS